MMSGRRQRGAGGSGSGGIVKVEMMKGGIDRANANSIASRYTLAEVKCIYMEGLKEASRE